MELGIASISMPLQDFNGISWSIFLRLSLQSGCHFEGRGEAHIHIESLFEWGVGEQKGGWLRSLDDHHRAVTADASSRPKRSFPRMAFFVFLSLSRQ